MITISACLIVKNEEEVLERCLQSLQGIYDELIIVDTGSTDRTKEIARTYTDKVYDFEWVNDFSAARNFLFSKANMDYIYVADADEVIEPGERDKFIQLKKVMLTEIEIVQMKYSNQLEFNTTYNFDMEYRPKLYKRLRSFVWQDPIHESVRLEPIIYDSDIIIMHCPTSNHGERDFKLFQLTLERDGNLSKKLWMMYARELFIAGKEQDFLEAERFFCGQLESTTNIDQLKQTYAVLICCARIRKDLMKLLSYSTKAFAGQLECSEICFELGEFYYSEQMYEEAILWFYNAAFECESELNIKYQKEFPYDRLSKCYQLIGDTEKAQYYENLISENASSL